LVIGSRDRWLVGRLFTRPLIPYRHSTLTTFSVHIWPIMRVDGSINHHNKPRLFYCPRSLSGDRDTFSQFSLSFDSPATTTFKYRCFPIDFSARYHPWFHLTGSNQTPPSLWRTTLTLSPASHFAISFHHPIGCSALAFSSDNAYQLYLGPNNVSAKFFGQFDGFRANFDMDIGDITTFITTFIRGDFLCGCHLQMHTEDVGTNRNSCFCTWEHPIWSHSFRVTFPVVALQEFSFIYGSSFRSEDGAKMKSTLAYGPRQQISFTFGTKFEWENWKINFFMGQQGIGDAFAVKARLNWRITKDVKVEIAKLTDHYEASLRRKLQDGIVLKPSLRYKEGLIGVGMEIVTKE
jgi:hypothetical protein